MKIILSVVLSFICMNCFAQRQSSRFYIGGGYSFSKGGYEGLNNVIDFYNRDSTSTDRMNDIDIVKGFSIMGGFKIEFMIIEMGYTQRRSNISSVETGTGSSAQIRELRLHNNSFGFRLGYVIEKEFAEYIFGLGFDIGAATVFTRSYPKNDILKPDFMDVHDITGGYTHPTLGITFSTQLNIKPLKNNIVSLGIRPFYQLHPFSVSYRSTNMLLNPHNYEDMDEDMRSSRPHNYGIELRVNLNIGES